MKIKLPSFVRGFLYKGIDVLWEKWLSRGYDPRRTIVVAGTPRGGTTWLAETLANLPGHLYLHEPLAPSHVAETLAKAHPLLHLWEPLPPHHPATSGAPRVGAELYVASNYLLYEHIKRTIAGKIRLTKYYSFRGALPNMRFFQRLVVKLIRGNLLLDWILKEFGLKGALIIRHPCAVVASQIHHKRGGVCCGDAQSLELIRKHRLPIYEQFDPSFAEVIRSVNTSEELLALEWCIRTVVTLRQPKPHPWFLTTYEGLIEDTREWEMLCGYLDCPVPAKDVITRLSSMSERRHNESFPSASIDKWRRYLSEKQIEDILRVCSVMGVDLYDKTLYPKNLDRYRT